MQKPFVFTFFCSSQTQIPPAQTATCAKFGLGFYWHELEGKSFPLCCSMLDYRTRPYSRCFWTITLFFLDWSWKLWLEIASLSDSMLGDCSLSNRLKRRCQQYLGSRVWVWPCQLNQQHLWSPRMSPRD
jgi:hypothetical protein